MLMGAKQFFTNMYNTTTEESWNVMVKNNLGEIVPKLILFEPEDMKEKIEDIGCQHFSQCISVSQTDPKRRRSSIVEVPALKKPVKYELEPWLLAHSNSEPLNLLSTPTKEQTAVNLQLNVHQKPTFYTKMNKAYDDEGCVIPL